MNDDNNVVINIIMFLLTLKHIYKHFSLSNFLLIKTLTCFYI